MALLWISLGVIITTIVGWIIIRVGQSAESESSVVQPQKDLTPEESRILSEYGNIEALREECSNLIDKIAANEKILSSQKELIDSFDTQMVQSDELTEYRLSEQELEIEGLRSYLAHLRQELETLQKVRSNALIEDYREQEKEIGGTVQLSKRAGVEVPQLLNIVHHLENPVPLYKAIYDIYYRIPLAQMIVRQGANKICGIYKITNLKDGKVYVGQSVNIGDRWIAHCRRGTGCDVGTAASGKLYQAMLDEGIWNFKFEIVQEVERGMLNELEKYYIGLWATAEIGYNMKRG